MIKENIFKIKECISLACLKTKQNPKQITIVAVTKGRTIEEIIEARSAGITDIGENRVQEAIIKHNALRSNNQQLTTKNQQPRTVRWHMVGHLQTNKVKEAVRIFDFIQSVDSLHLALEINKQAAKINKVQDLLVQINTSLQSSKFGLKPTETIRVIEEMVRLRNISIKGLMTIVPIVDEPEKTRPFFRRLRELLEKINQLSTINYQLSTLSMGMSDDFEIAIEEGSTMVRLGRAIFSPQQI